MTKAEAAQALPPFSCALPGTVMLA